MQKGRGLLRRIDKLLGSANQRQKFELKEIQTKINKEIAKIISSPSLSHAVSADVLNGCEQDLELLETRIMIEDFGRFKTD